MSTDPTGDDAIGREVLGSVRDALDEARGEEEQLDLLDPITAEDVWDAREALGEAATPQEVTQAARARKAGRPKGSRNRRTDDLARYLMQFGQHPAITLMTIQNTAPEVLMEASKRRKVHSFQKDGTANVVVEHMTYEAAQSLRVRCADILLPYLESKKPVAVDMTFSGVADLIIEGVTHSASEVADIVDAEFVPAGELEGPQE